MAEDCLFCNIAAGEIPAKKVLENDEVIAFEDISPMMPVHVLVIPKDHYDDISDGIPAETLNAMIDAVGEVAKIKGVEETGYRVITNKGDDACQSVHHVHLHVLGGAKMNDGDPSLS